MSNTTDNKHADKEKDADYAAYMKSLRRRMRINSISRAELAKKLHLHPGTIRNWFCRRNAPHITEENREWIEEIIADVEKKNSRDRTGKFLYQIHLDHTFYDDAQVPEVSSFEFNIPRYGEADARRARVHKTMKGAETAVKKLLKSINIFDPFIHDWRGINAADEVVEEQPEGPGKEYKIKQWTVYVPIDEQYEDLWPFKCDVMTVTIALVEVVQ